MASFLTFPSNRATQSKARALNKCAVATAKQYDPDIMKEYGLTRVLENKLVERYHDGFVDEGLLRMFNNDQPGYKELVVEFIASFKFDQSEQEGSFNNKPRIKFRLLSRPFTMNLVDFGFYLGLVDQNVDKELYQEHLDFAYVLDPDNFRASTTWDEIGMVAFDARNARESHLKNPLLRILHRYLAWTLLYSSQPEKINEQQIKGLHFCLHRDNRWNLPYVMALMFVAARENEPNELPGGQFITTIATNLGLLNQNILRNMSPPVKREIKGRNAMMLAMILKPENGSHRLYREFEPKPGMEGIIIGAQGNQDAGTSTAPSSSRQTRRRTSQGARRGRNVAIDLEHIARQNDALGHYNDELQHMVWQADQRAHARFMTSFTGDLPPYLLEDFSELRLWNERMGYPNEGQGDVRHEED